MPHHGTTLLSVAFAATGFTALMYQVVLTRELIVAFVGNELTISIILLAWLLLVAGGSGLGARLAARRPTPGLLAGLLVLLVPMMALGLVLSRLAGQQGEFPGELASPGMALLLTAVSLAPTCVVLGALFAVGCALLERIGGGAGRVYVLEAVGAVVAGTLFHFYVADHLSAVATIAALGAINALIASWLALKGAMYGRGIIGYLLAALCLTLLIWPKAAHDLDKALLTLRFGPDLVDWTNTRYGLWSVDHQAEQLTFRHDGMPVFATGPAAEPESVHLALAAHPDPRWVLMIGGGPPAVREVLKHPVTRIDYVELDRGGLQFVRRHVPSHLAAVLDDPRVHLQFTDGRAFVKHIRARYDVIIADLPDPGNAVINRYYTAQFFAEAARALKPDGLLMTGLRSPRTTLTGERRLTLGGVWHALSEHFPVLDVLPVGESLYFIAHPDPSAPHVRADELGERMTARGVETLFVTPFALRAELNPLACAMAREAVTQAQAPVNTDFRPVAYHLQMRLWVRQFMPRAELAWLDPLASRVIPGAAWGLVLVGIVAALLSGRRVAGRVIAVGAAIFLVGLLEMGVQLSVVFAFQAIAGYLYHQIGLLMTLNMLGLALGAWGARRIPSGRAAFGFVVLCAAFVALCAAMPWLMRVASSPALSTPILGAVALVASVLTGAAFPLGVSLTPTPEARAGPSLYALDLVGGALGAAVVGVLLVPVTGLDASTRTLAVLGVASLVAAASLLYRRSAKK